MSTSFVAPDGKAFQIRKEYREYMIDNFLSIKNKTDEEFPIVRKQGEVNGQPFIIENCKNSTLVVMDCTEGK